MKLKDIVVGQEYAVGAPVSGSVVCRGRVAAVRVRGEAAGPPRSLSSVMTDPTYVEVEIVEGRQNSLPSYARVDVLEADIPQLGSAEFEGRQAQKAGDPYRRLQYTSGPDPRGPKTRKAYRVPASFILRPWDEQAQRNAERERVLQEVRDEQKALAAREYAAAQVVDRHLGVYLEVGKLTLEQLEAIARKLELKEKGHA